MAAVVMRDYRGNYELAVGGRVVSGGPCDIHLDDAFLVIKGPRVHRIPYEEIESVRNPGWTVELALHPEGRIALSGLDGALVRPLYFHLSRLRGARWADLLRFVEGELLGETTGKVSLGGGRESEALVRLYPASLVVLPLGGEPVQLPLYEIDAISLEGYGLRLRHGGDSATLSGGEPGNLVRFHGEVVGARRAMENETAEILVELFPALGSGQIARLTALLLGGKAASKRDIDAAVPWLWARIEEVIGGSPDSASSYGYLRRRAGDRVWVGLRKATGVETAGLNNSSEASEPGPAGVEPASGPAQGVLLWYMAGIPGAKGNWMVVEVMAATTGYATYVYRCLEGGQGEEAFDATADVLSRSLLALNFHREPLYAPQREIETGRFAEYKLALRKLDYLRIARSLFVGRAIHTAAWQSNLEELLSRS